MSDPKNLNQTEGSKTAKPFSEGEEAGAGKSPGMDQAPHDRADAVGDDRKQDEMPKVTQRQE